MLSQIRRHNPFFFSKCTTHFPGTFHSPALTSFIFERFFYLYWTPCVNTLPAAAHWWNVQSCPRYKCLAQCSQLGIGCLWLSLAAWQRPVIKYIQISLCPTLVYVDQKYDILIHLLGTSPKWIITICLKLWLWEHANKLVRKQSYNEI